MGGASGKGAFRRNFIPRSNRVFFDFAGESAYRDITAPRFRRSGRVNPSLLTARRRALLLQGNASLLPSTFPTARLRGARPQKTAAKAA
jgi:hypothetical protein